MISNANYKSVYAFIFTLLGPILTNPSIAADVEADLRPMLRKINMKDLGIGLSAYDIASDPRFYISYRSALKEKDQFETVAEFKERKKLFRSQSVKLMDGIYAFRVKLAPVANVKFSYDAETKRASIRDYFGGSMFDLDVKSRSYQTDEILRNNFGVSVPVEAIVQEKVSLSSEAFGGDSISIRFNIGNQDARAIWPNKEFLIVGTFPAPSIVVNDNILYIHRESDSAPATILNPVRANFVTYNAPFNVQSIYMLDNQQRIYVRGEFRTCGMGNGVGADACSDWKK